MTADDVLRRGLERRGGEHLLTLDPAFQGLPDTAHGGSVLAAFHALAGAPEHGLVHGTYRRRVPLAAALPVRLEDRDGAFTCTLHEPSDPTATLVDGGVERGAPAAVPPRPLAVAAVDESPPPLDEARAHPAPISLSCFACGQDNPLGLRARLLFDDALVGGAWTPRDTLAAAGGRLAPVALMALLDEAAFWLGALASGESGMTTELAVRLHGAVAYGGPIHVRGRRGLVRQRDDDARYWDTAVAAWTDDGRPVAEARITFVAVRGAARRLITRMLGVNPPDVVRRVFPAYAS